MQETGVTLEVDVLRVGARQKLVTTQSLFEPFESRFASGAVKRLQESHFTTQESGETTFLSVGAGEVRLLRSSVHG